MCRQTIRRWRRLGFGLRLRFGLGLGLGLGRANLEHAYLVLEAPPRTRVAQPLLVEGLDRDELQRQTLLRDAHEAVSTLADGLAWLG